MSSSNQFWGHGRHFWSNSYIHVTHIMDFFFSRIIVFKEQHHVLKIIIHELCQIWCLYSTMCVSVCGSPRNTLLFTWSLSKEGKDDNGESGGAISRNTVYVIMLSATTMQYCNINSIQFSTCTLILFHSLRSFQYYIYTFNHCFI